MNAFSAQNLGPPVFGLVGAEATNTTQETATLVTAQTMVFTNVASGGAAILPSVGASGTSLTIYNKHATNPLLVYPPKGGSIAGNAIDTPITVVPNNGSAVFLCFDPPAASPLNWYLINPITQAGGSLSGPLYMGSNLLSGSNVAVTGGSVDGVAVGATTPATGAFTSLTASGNATLSGGGTVSGTYAGAPTWSGSHVFSGSGTALSVTNNAAIGGTLGVTGAASVGGTLTLGTGGTSGQRIQASGTGNMVLQLGGASSIWNFTSSGGASLFQIGGASNQITTKQQMIFQAQGGAAPVWSGNSIAAMVPLQSNLTWSGTSTVAGNNTMLLFNLNATTSVGVTPGLAALGGNITVTTAAGNTGNASALHVALTQNSTNGNAASSAVYTALSSYVNMLTNDNGVPGNPSGSQTALNLVSHWGSGATYTLGGSGVEIDIWTESGSYLQGRSGILIDITSGSAVQGSLDDAAIKIDAQTIEASAAASWKRVLQVGSYAGYSGLDPVNGWVLGFMGHTGAGTIAGAGGLDFTNFVPTTAFLRGNNFLLDPSGNWTAASYTVGSGGPTLTTGSAAPSGTQPKGSIYLRTSGSTGSTLYVSQGGGTWNAVTGV